MAFCLECALGHTWKAALEGCENIHVRIILFWGKVRGLGRTGLPGLEPWACHHMGQHLLASSSWAGNTVPAAVPAAGQEISSLAASVSLHRMQRWSWERQLLVPELQHVLLNGALLLLAENCLLCC